jgi:hypothetical protein
MGRSLQLTLPSTGFALNFIRRLFPELTGFAHAQVDPGTYKAARYLLDDHIDYLVHGSVLIGVTPFIY